MTTATKGYRDGKKSARTTKGTAKGDGSNEVRAGVSSRTKRVRKPAKRGEQYHQTAQSVPKRRIKRARPIKQPNSTRVVYKTPKTNLVLDGWILASIAAIFIFIGYALCLFINSLYN